MVQKFSKIEDKEVEEKDDIVYRGNYLNVVNHNDWEIISEPHMVAILPYLKDDGMVLLRHEFIPSYQYYYKDIDDYNGITHFLTSVTGVVDKGESIENALRRELYEETGIVLSNLYKIEIGKNLFLSKGNISQYHICLLELNYNDYKITQPKGDGSKEEDMSKTIKVNISDLEDIRTHDLITDYLITKFRLEYKL
jgi:8-oxo-dGTP pyrophosphatase MutT (NUDIX family)